MNGGRLIFLESYFVPAPLCLYPVKEMTMNQVNMLRYVVEAPIAVSDGMNQSQRQNIEISTANKGLIWQKYWNRSIHTRVKTSFISILSFSFIKIKNLASVRWLQKHWKYLNCSDSYTYFFVNQSIISILYCTAWNTFLYYCVE